jgi:hypothetical protein
MNCDHPLPNTTAAWKQASIVLNCATYGEQLHASVGHQLALSCLLALLIVPLAAVVTSSCRDGLRTSLFSGARVQAGTAIVGGYSVLAGRAVSTSMSEWRDAHLGPPAGIDFCALQTLVGSLAVVCLVAQAATAALGRERSCGALSCSGAFAAMLMPFFWYFGVVHALGFGDAVKHMKEVFGHLVIGVGFISFGGVMLCYGPDQLLRRTPIHRLEHRMMIIAGVLYGPMERMMGTNYLHMHFITACAWAVFGVLGLLLEISHPAEAARGAAFSIALMYHGFMMYNHLQPNDTAKLLHVTHGVLAIVAGMFRFAGNPRLAGLVLQVAGFVFICSQIGATDTAVALWGTHAPSTYVLLSVQCGVLMAVLPTLVVFNIARSFGCEGTLKLQLCQRCNGDADGGVEGWGDTQARGGGAAAGGYGGYAPISLSDEDDDGAGGAFVSLQVLRYALCPWLCYAICHMPYAICRDFKPWWYTTRLRLSTCVYTLRVRTPVQCSTHAYGVCCDMYIVLLSYCPIVLL